MSLTFPFREILAPPAAPAAPDSAPQEETAALVSMSPTSSPIQVAADPVIERMAVMLRRRAAAHSKIARHLYRAARDLKLSAKLIG